MAVEQSLSNKPPLDESINHCAALIKQFIDVRDLSLQIIEPLSIEDCQIQAMADVSPMKWHLAHTTWFFETFILQAYQTNFRIFDPIYNTLFNSYYNALGQPFDRASRGALSRPSLKAVIEYRQYIDNAMVEYYSQQAAGPLSNNEDLLDLLRLGIAHEQQHQELMLMDCKYNFYQNPMQPAYLAPLQDSRPELPAPPLKWLEFSSTTAKAGTSSSDFSYDNERPEHDVLLPAYRLASRLVTNAEFMQFVKEGGYQNSRYWLSDGWQWVQAHNIAAPLYWQKTQQVWQHFTLKGLVDIHPNEPVAHISYFEADAYASWAGKRLPTEFEWEHACRLNKPASPDYLQLNQLTPALANDQALAQMMGELWQWTSSNYRAYPGFKPFSGNAGEYNGKFMNGQYILRGGCCVTPADHMRISYRNFFYPHQRWQFSGIRLAEDSQ